MKILRYLLFAVMGISMLLFFSCEMDPVLDSGFEPVRLDDGIPVSTPQNQGMDPDPLQNLYDSARELGNVDSLLVLKNGFLIGERYYNGHYYADIFEVASVTKSVTSALAGIALDRHLIQNPDLLVKDYFPEIDWENLDPAKSEISIRQMLQMRSGYPWEEREGDYLSVFINTPSIIGLLAEFPLTSTPGTTFGYSNLTAHITGVIVSRAAGRTLLAFAQEFLFDPLGITKPNWPVDEQGNNIGCSELEITARDMAKFGLLYLNNGNYQGNRIVPAQWVEDSFERYTESTHGEDFLDSIRRLGYGYMWWSGFCGSHRIDFAWGQGGQLIVLVRLLNMIVVTTASSDWDWQMHKNVLELVGTFISAL